MFLSELPFTNKFPIIIIKDKIIKNECISGNIPVQNCQSEICL